MERRNALNHCPHFQLVRRTRVEGYTQPAEEAEGLWCGNCSRNTSTIRQPGDWRLSQVPNVNAILLTKRLWKQTTARLQLG